MFYGLVGYMRLKRPVQVVALAMHSDGGCHNSLRLSRRYNDISEFCPLVSSEVMAFVLTDFGGIEASDLRHLRASWHIPDARRCDVVDFGEATGHVFIDRSSRGRRAIFMNASGADLDRVHRQRRPFHHKDVIPPRLECR